VEHLHGGAIEHCDVAVAGQDFLAAFDCGDELFETAFNAVDGVGANVGDGGRFTRGPRADLAGPGEWASHLPARDPFVSADPGRFIQRNTPHLFGPGALQRLAEEMTGELRARFEAGVAEACARGARVDVALSAKGVSFGSIGVDCGGAVDGAGLEGVSADLIVRPFQWKGVEPTLRSFSRGAEHNELAKLGKHDRIAELGLPVLSRDDLARISRGEELFVEIGCADCHRPALVIDDPVFSEPSRTLGYRDDPFPAGQPALAQEIRFDLTRDLPDNRFALGRRRLDLGNFERTRAGGAIVRLYGDLKRHDMGPGLAENVDETGHGASTWLTQELWGVGSSAEYLHDGRATTLAEAIFEHGGAAEASRAPFAALSERDGASVVRFLENLVLFFPEEEAPTQTQAATRPTTGDGHRTR
jgi:hypothetical protein